MRTFCSPLVWGSAGAPISCGSGSRAARAARASASTSRALASVSLLLQRLRDRLVGERQVVRGGRELGAGAGLRRFDRGLLQVVRKDQYCHQHEHPKRRRENVECRDGQYFQGLLTANPHLDQSV